MSTTPNRISSRFFYVVLLLHSIILLSVSFVPNFAVSEHDEPFYFGAGSVIWHKEEVANRMTECHPPLTYYMNSLLLGANPVEWSKVTDWFGETVRLNDESKLHFEDSIGWDLLWQTGNSGRSVPWLFFRGRIPFVLLSIAFAWLLFSFSRQINSQTANTVSVLYGLSPLVLFIAPGIMTDLTVTVLITLSIISLSYWSVNFKKRFALLAGLLTGLALTSKVSALTLLPVFLFAAFHGSWVTPLNKKTACRSAVQGLLISMVSAFIVLWATYGFQVDTLKNTQDLHHSLPYKQRLMDHPPKTRLERNFPRLFETRLPAVSFYMPVRSVFLRRGDILERTTVEGPLSPFRNTFLYPWTVLVTYFPLAFFPFVGVSIWLLLTRWNPLFIRSRWLIVAAWPVLYAATSFTSKYFYGSRHIFPLFPATLLISGVIIGKLASHKVLKGLLYTTVGLTVAEAILYLTTNHPWSLWMFVINQRDTS